MKIFISWSGNRSKAVAEVINTWVKCVLQATDPWISTRNIDRGSIWFSEINERLKDVTVGIVCLTQENKNKPWILFEAGALAKGLFSSRVCTVLVDLVPSDLTDPLAQFNHTRPDREGMYDLLCTLNSCLAENALPLHVLEKAFGVYWPIFEKDFKHAVDSTPPEEVLAPRAAEDVLSEILENTRTLGRRVARLESVSSPVVGSTKALESALRKQGSLAGEAIALQTMGLAKNDIKDHFRKKYGVDDLESIRIFVKPPSRREEDSSLPESEDIDKDD